MPAPILIEDAVWVGIIFDICRQKFYDPLFDINAEQKCTKTLTTVHAPFLIEDGVWVTMTGPPPRPATRRRQESERQEAKRRETERQESERQEARRRETERQESERQEAKKR